MKLLVFGATGGTGREIVAQGLDQGHVVTAFVRNPAAITTKHEKLKLAQGDVLDYPSVEAAVQGQDAVLSALGVRVLSVPSRNSRRAPCTLCVSWQFRQPAFQTGRPAGNSRWLVAAAV